MFHFFKKPANLELIKGGRHEIIDISLGLNTEEWLVASNWWRAEIKGSRATRAESRGRICHEDPQKVTKLFVKLAFQKRRDRVFWLF
jgi:hypothetical protein